MFLKYILLFVLNEIVFTLAYSIDASFKGNYVKREQPNFHHANGLLNKVDVDASKRVSKYSCRDKEDEGHYEHEECRKYWHCLYVGTIFEYALERKCPIGTMFHPIGRNCEISTMLTCKGWKKSIYGKNYEDNFFTSTVPLNLPFVNYNQPFNNNNNHNNYNKKPGDDYDNKEYFYSQETTMYSGELLRTFNLMPTTSSNYELVNTHSIITKRPLTKKKTKQFTTIPTTTSTTTTTSTFKIDTSTTTISTKLTSIKFKPRTKLKTSTASTTHKHSPVTLQSQTTTSLTSDNKYSLIVSSFLEKLRNLEQTAPDKSVAELPKQNYTILTATGKKTVLVPGDKPKFDLNETIVERLNYLAEIYSKKINNTKLMNQIEIIKNIFALKNRDTTATSTILAKTSSTTLSPSTLKALINEENASTAASNEDSSDMTKQFDAYFDGLETSTILQTVTNVNIKENLDSYYDESYEDSLENEDLSILDSDLLLNLQLNTFSTNPNKLNAKILAPSHDLTQQLKGNDETDESQSEEDGEGGGGGGSGGSSEMVLNAIANQNSLKSSVAGFYSQKFTILINFLTFSVYVYYESSFLIQF